MDSLFQLTHHHDIAGANAVFALTFVSAAIYLFSFIYDRILTGNWHDASRIMTGFSIMCIGVAIRIGFWIPWRSYLAKGDLDRAAWYRDYAWLWTWGGVLLALLGLLIIMYPSLRRICGAWVWLVVFAGPALFYVIGVTAAEYLP